ncbi:MAG TPA: hypothetical protein VGC14_21070, partial [Rhizobium sp.]
SGNAGCDGCYENAATGNVHFFFPLVGLDRYLPVRPALLSARAPPQASIFMAILLFVVGSPSRKMLPMSRAIDRRPNPRGLPIDVRETRRLS